MADGALRKFMVSFKTWWEHEVPETGLLKETYLGYDNYDGGRRYLDIKYGFLYKLHLGVSGFEYSEAIGPDCGVDTFKGFIELIYEECVQDRYQFTIEVNKRLKKFGVPYKLQGGKLVKEGYQTTEQIQVIYDWQMCERKILFSQEMISSRELLDKKVALDYVVDALQYLVSLVEGQGITEKCEVLAKIVAGNEKSKSLTVVRNEIREVMKISNEFFDIRHNEYLNKANEIREPLSDSAFIEYLYNRVFALAYLLRLRHPLKSQTQEAGSQSF